MATDFAALATMLRSGDPKQQAAAAEELAGLGTAAQCAAVLLVEACASNDETREWVVAALEGLGPPMSKDVSALASLLHKTSLDTAYWAATLLGRLEAAAAPATADLVEALQHHGELAVRQRAAWALGKIGPAAGAAITALQAASSNSDKRLAALAREAIEQVQK